MNARRTYKVNDVARLSGVSVRALHHYDALGLLVPSGRSPAGYRLYDDEDLLRLQHILAARELGLPLMAIKRWLDDPQFDRRAALLEQLEQLNVRAEQTAKVIASLRRALEWLDTERNLDMDRKELFDGFDPAAYEEEAKERWGSTPAYREAARRTKRYTKQDWQRFAAEQAALYSEIAAAQRAGKDPASEEAMALAERHRESIDRWFYPCSSAQHAALADLYEHDRRYAQNMDKFGAGLTDYLIAAIRANAERNA